MELWSIGTNLNCFEVRSQKYKCVIVYVAALVSAALVSAALVSAALVLKKLNLFT